ncbi:MAG: DUF2889 domain-containing protein, partial [Deltaproteobacteria bacterium]|nr:DUF2889 domain-containing protein [Deltaproteobacteria bacterium]
RCRITTFIYFHRTCSWCYTGCTAFGRTYDLQYPNRFVVDYVGYFDGSLQTQKRDVVTLFQEWCINKANKPSPLCANISENLQKLVGRNFQKPNFRRTLLRAIGGERGCFRVLELLAETHDYVQSFFRDRSPDKEGHFKIPKINQEGKVECIAYRKE